MLDNFILLNSCMAYNSRKLFGYNTGSVYIPQKSIRKMRNLPPYIRTVKGKGKRTRKRTRRRKICRRCKRKGLQGGRFGYDAHISEKEAKHSFLGRLFSLAYK